MSGGVESFEIEQVLEGCPSEQLFSQLSEMASQPQGWMERYWHRGFDERMNELLRGIEGSTAGKYDFPYSMEHLTPGLECEFLVAQPAKLCNCAPVTLGESRQPE